MAKINEFEISMVCYNENNKYTLDEINDMLVEWAESKDIYLVGFVKPCAPEETSDESAALPLHGVINWVACEERLPKPRERVLVTDGTLVVEAHLNQRNGYWEGWNITGTESLGDITMWAYKPKPPCL